MQILKAYALSAEGENTEVFIYLYSKSVTSVNSLPIAHRDACITTAYFKQGTLLIFTQGPVLGLAWPTLRCSAPVCPGIHCV